MKTAEELWDKYSMECECRWERMRNDKFIEALIEHDKEIKDMIDEVLKEVAFPYTNTEKTIKVKLTELKEKI